MPEWGFTLAENLDGVVRCNNCQMDFYAHKSDKCPWCDVENKILRIRSKKDSNGEMTPYWEFIHEQQEEYIDIPLRVLAGFS